MREHWRARTSSSSWSVTSQIEKRTGRWNGKRRADGPQSIVCPFERLLNEFPGLTYDRCPFPRDVLADGRQRGGAVPASCTIHFAIDRIWSNGSREGREWSQLRRSRLAARE